MNKIKIILLIIVCSFFYCSFILIKKTISTERNKFFFIDRNQEIIQYLNLVSTEKIRGIILLATLKNETDFEVRITNENDELLVFSKASFKCATGVKYQTIKFLFQKDIEIYSTIKIKFQAASACDIWYSDLTSIENQKNFFSINNSPTNGILYLEFIKDFDLKNKKKIILNKIFNNTNFNIFYFILISLLALFCIYIFFFYHKKIEN